MLSGPFHKEELPVERLRKELVQVDSRILPAKTQCVLAMNPAQRFNKIVVVLCLKLICWRRRADLKPRTTQGELVDGFCDVVGWPVDTELIDGNWGNVDQAVVDSYEPKRKSFTTEGENK